MSKVVKRRWATDVASGLPRRDRATCEYEAYIPDPLVGRPIRLDGDVAADVADAERAIAQFDTRGNGAGGYGGTCPTTAPSRVRCIVEDRGSGGWGSPVASREAAQALGDEPNDVTANEVLGNIQAMTWALETVGEGDDITVDTLLEAHRRLLEGTRVEEHGGHERDEQNWIGGSSYNPCSAAFVPPPPEHVKRLLEDLCKFANSDDLPAVAQAAIAHAQFETIHPFVDGNGRIGRALIHLILRRRGLAVRVVPPISLILATWSKDYITGLTSTRYIGSPTSPPAVEGMNSWIALFATACRRAIRDAMEFEEHVTHLQEEWRDRLNGPRSGSAADLLIRTLPGAPIVTVSGAAELIGRTFQATNQAITRLVGAGILAQVNVGRRNRAFEAPELIKTFTDLERRLASPTGDTRSSRPTRRVPQRAP